MTAWKHAWITGASSGIGAALAIELAKSGTTVSVSARSTDKLNNLSAQQTGIHPVPLDVTDQEAVAAAVPLMEQAHGPIDLVVLNAGLWQPAEAGVFEGQAAVQSIEVNYLGVTHAIAAALPGMKQRGAGQIVIVSSVAGYRGLPKSAYYGPTKAALINLAETLQPELAPEGIKVQLINPGFVDTPMTKRNEFPMPFIMHVDDAVRHIRKGLHSNAFEIAFPWQLVTLLKVGRVLPYRLYLWLMSRIVARF